MEKYPQNIKRLQTIVVAYILLGYRVSFKYLGVAGQTFLTVNTLLQILIDSLRM